jgi:predicted metalloprotease with PDZ domain
MAHHVTFRKPAASAALLATLVAAPVALAAPAAGPAPDFTVRVDARECARGILHVTQSFPATGGAPALAYPRWIPGEHGPTGPGVDVAGFVARTGTRVLPWRRDPRDMSTLRVEVPPGARQVEVSFDFLLESSTEGFTSAACATPNLLLLSWNQVAFYPAGRRSDSLTAAASLILPQGWRHASSLEELGASDGSVRFAPCTFTRLVDSPVLAGRHFRTVDLSATDGPPVRLRMACDSPEGLAIPDPQVQALRNLVREARALFGGEHFRHYDFLVSLSETIAHFGLEHHESSDNRGRERWWLDDALRRDHSNLLAHEYSHSWNGKFRRPAGLATGDFFTPMEGELLWVYEGLTQYLGFVLAARSGIRTPEEARDALARAAASKDANRGRAWRPLVDTGTHAQELYGARTAWEHWRRGTDFYDEGLLVWLEADVTIRSLTGGRKSLDDFCRAFHGGPNRGPEVRPYTLADVVATLETIAPHDWAGFFRERVDEVRPQAPLGGILAGGWRLGWADTLGPLQAAEETADEKLVESYSLGFELDKDGRVRDIVPGSPAAAAGLAPDMKLVAVNGRRYGKDVLRDAIAASERSGTVELLCESKEFYRTHRLAYRGGRRHPALERDAARRDFVSEILAARAK